MITFCGLTVLRFFFLSWKTHLAILSPLVLRSQYFFLFWFIPLEQLCRIWFLFVCQLLEHVLNIQKEHWFPSACGQDSAVGTVLLNFYNLTLVNIKSTGDFIYLLKIDIITTCNCIAGWWNAAVIALFSL